MVAKCYYCDDAVTNDDLTLIDGQWLRVCADCREFIKEFGANGIKVLEDAMVDNIVKSMKSGYRVVYRSKERSAVLIPDVYK